MSGYKFLSTYFLIFLMFLSTGVVSQPVENMDELTPVQLRSYGENSERIGDYYSAIEFFERYVAERPENFKITYQLAKNYHKARNYPKALEMYERVYNERPNKYPLAQYYLARMQMVMGEYELALKNLDDFKSRSRDLLSTKDQKIFRKLIKSSMEGCEMAQGMIDTPLIVEINHVDTSINRAHGEFSPIPVNDTLLIYAALRADSIVYYPDDEVIKQLMEEKDTVIEKPGRLFYSAVRQGDNWKFKDTLPEPFNEEGVQTGNGALTPDGKKFFFTKCKPDWRGKMICHIWYTTKDSLDQWQEPVKMGEHINHPKYSSTQPCVSSESRRGREVLYFVTDRPGGKGGLDIWYSMYNPRDGSYKDPRYAGSKLNTVGNEMTPWYDFDSRTLYFSSDGHPGLGELDIFKATGEKSRYTEPENVGYPVNTGVDELYYILEKNRDKGFFVSNRAGGVALRHETCCDDIYSFKYLDFIHVAVAGEVREAPDTSENFDYRELENAEVSLYMMDPESGEPMFIKKETTDKNGNYQVNLESNKEYRLVLSKDGFFSKNMEVSTMGIIESDTLPMDPVTLKKIPKKPIVIKNIYYKFDKAELTDTAKTVIDTTLYDLLMENEDIIIEISSHTDGKGTDRYNERLSQKRAESVAKHLVSKGIEKERLVAKGYGESQPIAPNTNPDGSDNPEGRRKNRRTEFKVIGKLDRYSDVEYEE